MKKHFILTPLLLLAAACSGTLEKEEPVVPQGNPSLSELAGILSELPIGKEQMEEVRDAVSASSGNGYDEEYMMKDLFLNPGNGVGTKGSSRQYRKPLRDLISDYLQTHGTKASGRSPEEYIKALTDSDLQLYWYDHESWDGEQLPVITFDPGFGAESGYGYELHEDGSVDSVYVDEAVARSRTVWVVNKNDDSAFTPQDLFVKSGASPLGTKAAADGRNLLIKSFTMLRNYDSWFGGASEFWVKCGSVSGFKAASESDLKLYSPSVTDAMIVVKRKYVGKELPLDALLFSGFTNQLDKIAFMITEDDGGTRTGWKCSASVKIASKTYGFEMELPYSDKDDIVWRGQLSSAYFQEEDQVTGRFGDVKVSFALE